MSAPCCRDRDRMKHTDSIQQLSFTLTQELQCYLGMNFGHLPELSMHGTKEEMVVGGWMDGRIEQKLKENG